MVGWTAELRPLIAAGVTLGPEAAAYGAVGAALLLLFRVVFRTMSRTDTEQARQFSQLRREVAHARAWQQYERDRADHWYARALGDPNPPPHPTHPPPLSVDAAPAVLAPPE